MSNQPNNADAVLFTPAGPPAWKFPNPGDTHTGVISEDPVAFQERDYDPNNPGGGPLKFWPSGDPIMSVRVTVDTTERDPAVVDDDGRRTFYVQGRYLKDGVRDAVKAAGAPGLRPGGRISVTFTHREDPMDKRSRKYWQVAYQAPAPAADTALMTDPAGPATQPAGLDAEQLKAFAAWQAAQQRAAADTGIPY